MATAIQERDEAPTIEGEVVGSGGLQAVGASALEAMVRGEIDIQIATAKKWPRSVAEFTKRAKDMALIDEDTAQSCLYSRPVGKKKGPDGRWVEERAEGMSIRMAEIVGTCWGNLRVGAMLVGNTPEYVVTRGIAHDLESNFLSTSEVIESTLTKEGVPYSPRMRMVVAKAALAKARRDATFQVVPKAMARPIEAAIRDLLFGEGKGKSLDKRRQMVLQWIEKIGIDKRRVWVALGVQGPEDLGVDKLVELTGLRTAIKDHETTVDDAFPELTKEQHEQNRDVVGEVLAGATKEQADEVRALFQATQQSRGQQISWVRKYSARIPELLSVLRAMPTVENGEAEKSSDAGTAAKEPEQTSSKNEAEAGSSGGETRTVSSAETSEKPRETSSQTTGTVDGSTPQSDGKKKKGWTI